jgi:hypothetical protein
MAEKSSLKKMKSSLSIETISGTCQKGKTEGKESIEDM